ncbi:hypothetical protein [Geochorda subterranea]|uniref:Uncharacterized protein n=1 Tax=Geochorda subterranea TaxID=3109564 RepID=A0ABZ1BRT0_9FIRM|nr:hypothetical protein [Limnochorda sp. LNt]WRP14887.1 hypothetical protein VLY81_01560 [Limnochorda sp. LNt]
MPYERWLRVGAAASVLLLLLAGGALAGQWRSSQEAARLRQQIAQLERARQQSEGERRTPAEKASPVALTRVRVVPERVSGSFSVQATVTNRLDRQLAQPVHALLIISDPEDPEAEPRVQRRQALIAALAPGDTTTVVLEGFESGDPRLRHEVLVSTPAVDPQRTAETVAKVIPEVVAPARQPQQQAAPQEQTTPPQRPSTSAPQAQRPESQRPPANATPPAAEQPTPSPSDSQPTDQGTGQTPEDERAAEDGDQGRDDDQG